MSIAFVSVTNAAGTDTVSSLTASVVVPSGSNRCLVACLQTRSSGVDSAAASVIFNGGESLTKIRRDLNSVDAGSALWATELWYLLNPSVTTANVVASYHDAFNDGAMGLSVVLLTGVNGLDASSGAVSPDGATTTLSAAITTGVANAWLVDSAIGRDDAGLTMVSHTNRTQRTNRVIGVNNEGVGVSTLGDAVAPGSYTMDWQQLGGGGVYEWAMSIASFSPSSSTPPFIQQSYTPDALPFKPYPSRLAVQAQDMMQATWLNFYPAPPPPPAGDFLMPASIW